MSSRLSSKACALILSLLSVIPWASTAQAQDPQNPATTKGKLRTSFVIVPEVKMSSINHRFASFVGVRGGLVFNRRLLIGAGAYGVANTGTVMSMGYGGVVAEYAYSPGHRVHLAAGGLIGAGGLSLGTNFSVAEPGVRAVINLTKRLHLGFGASYRFVWGAGPLNTPLRGATATIGVGFGG